MRSICLGLLLGLSACTPTRPDPYEDYDYSRPVPVRVVDGVQIVGPYGARDVEQILMAVRSQTNEPILRISVSTETLQRFYRGEIEALPTDEAEVQAGESCEGRCGGGPMYHLEREPDGWLIHTVGAWRG